MQSRQVSIGGCGPGGPRDEAALAGGATVQWIDWAPRGDVPRPVGVTVSGTSLGAVVVGEAAGITGGTSDFVVDLLATSGG